MDIIEPGQQENKLRNRQGSLATCYRQWPWM